MQTEQHTTSAEPTVDQRVVWAKTVALTALAAASLQVCIVVYGTFGSLAGRTSHTPFVPWTFHTLWEIAFLVVAAFTAVRLGTQAVNFFAAIFLGGLVSGILWIFIPNSFVVLQPRYFGVESRITIDTHEAGRYGESQEYDFPLSKSFIYYKDDPELKEAMAELSQGHEYTGGRGFLFWQTGLADGYDPSLLEGYNGGKGFLSRVELFFTVGPLMIVEATLTGLTRHFPILMLIVGGLYLAKNENVWFA